MIRQDVAFCGQRTLEVPYGELGKVEVNHCFCLMCVDSGIGTLLPGMGCDSAGATEISTRLQNRVKGREDSKQQLMAQSISQRTNAINQKIDMIEAFLSPQSEAVEQEAISDR